MRKTGVFLATFALCICIAAQAAAARPLVTSSEETAARGCLAQIDTNARLIALCREALKSDRLTRSQRSELLAALGDAQSWADDDEGAVASYRAALELVPGSAGALNGLGSVALTQDDNAAAQDFYRRSIASGPTAIGLGGLAAAGYKTGAYGAAEATGMLRAAIAIEPDYPWAMREIGWIALAEGDTAGARAAFGEALERNDHDADAYYGVIRSYLRDKDFEKAVDTIDALLVFSPNDYAARLARVRALRAMDRNAAARRDAETLIARYPDRAEPRIELGRALMALQKRLDAFGVYEAATAEVGENALLLYWYADGLSEDGQDTAALAMIERSIRADATDPDSWSLKAYLQIRTGDYRGALGSTDKALALNPDDPWAQYYTALAMIHTETDPTGAIARYRSAEDNGLPDEMMAYFLRSLVGQGYVKEAVQVRLRLDTKPSL